MTKRLVIVGSVLALAVTALAQVPERGEAKATLAGKSVAVEYGRPSLKGRDMLGQAEIGQPWRMGANAATTLKTEADLSFGGAKVPKGDYILTATKQAAGEWVLNVLGTDRTKVADVPLTASKLDESVETFTIELKGEAEKGEFSMAWGDTVLKAPFTAN